MRCLNDYFVTNLVLTIPTPSHVGRSGLLGLCLAWLCLLEYPDRGYVVRTPIAGCPCWVVMSNANKADEHTMVRRKKTIGQEGKILTILTSHL